MDRRSAIENTRVSNVAAYCRVSTDHEDQTNSLASQKAYFKEYIDSNPSWSYIDLYVDEGISGTNINKRRDFQRMLADAKAHRFDLLLTKEVSRFARNTKDSLTYVDYLSDHGIGVIFINDNIDTRDEDQRFRLTIMASVAEEESRKTSERVKWGQRRRMEAGVVFGNGVYGYHLNTGKNRRQGDLQLKENPEQAEVVRLIFALYLDEGMGTTRLCQELENRGIRSPSGASRWSANTILKILRNEKYIGILKQHKEYTPEYKSHKKVLNRGQEDFVVIENSHEPIIDRETFERAQKELERRYKATEDKSRYSNRYAWSGKVICAYCEKRFKRKIWHAKRNPVIVWQCSENQKYGREKINDQGVKVGCNCKAVHEDILQNSFFSVLDGIVKNKTAISHELKQLVRQVMRNTTDNRREIATVDRAIEQLNQKSSILIDLFTDNGITRQEFDIKREALNKKRADLEQEKIRLQQEDQQRDNLEERLQTIDATIDQLAGFERFGDEICKEILQKVVVTDREHISFFLSIDRNPSLFAPLSPTPYLRRRARSSWLWKSCPSRSAARAVCLRDMAASAGYCRAF